MRGVISKDKALNAGFFATMPEEKRVFRLFIDREVGKSRGVITYQGVKNLRFKGHDEVVNIFGICFGWLPIDFHSFLE
jgi:hypothetical protein